MVVPGTFATEEAAVEAAASAWGVSPETFYVRPVSYPMSNFTRQSLLDNINSAKDVSGDVTCKEVLEAEINRLKKYGRVRPEMLLRFGVDVSCLFPSEQRNLGRRKTS